MVGQRYIPMLLFQLPNSTQGRASTPFGEIGNYFMVVMKQLP